MLRPGKGMHVPLDADLDVFLSAAFDELKSAGHQGTIAALVEAGWNFTADEFGRKAYVEYELDSGNTVRITIMEDKKGNPRLDVREWFVAK